ncbi:L,D-transpeptidase [Methylobacterium oryzihabitans]|uniref:L,D-transpeptidase n=1 Tax=Methylobacterium oryzihabitans TaxID=2499852 RepID=A0A3S2VZM3_9HYPH|nr:L,D-transpeptidase [Methylobacterium oryzihabitans]RVU21510.1 L,D-transpeptidase [Methylobacterium oryzihabitans]
MRAPTLLAAALLLAAGSAGPAAAAVLIAVDKSSQRMTVSVDGRVRYDWPVSTGRDGYDTPGGRFSPSRMVVDHRSREWDDAPMPHAIFFTGRGHAIHGSSHVRSLGAPASHGCVRLAPAKAALLYSLVKAEGLGATRVVIGGDVMLASRRAPTRAVARRAVEPAATRVSRRPAWPGDDGWDGYGSPWPAARPVSYAPTYSYGSPSW